MTINVLYYNWELVNWCHKKILFLFFLTRLEKRFNKTFSLSVCPSVNMIVRVMMVVRSHFYKNMILLFFVNSVFYCLFFLPLFLKLLERKIMETGNGYIQNKSTLLDKSVRPSLGLFVCYCGSNGINK